MYLVDLMSISKSTANNDINNTMLYNIMTGYVLYDRCKKSNS